MTNVEAVHRSDLYTMYTQRRKFVEMEEEKNATIHTVRRELERSEHRVVELEDDEDIREKVVLQLEDSVLELEDDKDIREKVVLQLEDSVLELEDDKDIREKVVLQLEDSVWELEDTMDRAREEIRGVFVQQY